MSSLTYPAVRASPTYYTVPLSLLHSGSSAREVLEHGVCCGIVNAGLGYRKTHGEPAFQTLLAQANTHARTHGHPTACPPGVELTLWEAALGGACLLHLPGGNRARDLRIHQ